MLKNRKKIIIPSLFYAFFYMTMGSYISYIGLYYESLNLDNVQIGLISSVGILFGMLAQPLWGTISDRSKNKTFILRAMLIVSACIIWLIPLSGRVFIYVMISTALFRFFFNSIPPVGDSIALEIAKKEKFKFSTVRMLGSVGFAIAAAVTGKIYATNIAYIFMIFFVLIISSGFISFFLPPVVGNKKEQKNKDSFFDLFKDRKLNVYYIYIFLLTITYSFFLTFHAIYSKDMGIGTGIIGLAVMIGSFSQFPFMFTFHWIYDKFGINKILIIAGLSYALRWFLYFSWLNSATIFFVFALHGLTFMLVYLSLAEYVSRNANKNLKTRGQMMNFIVLGGPSAIIGSSAGGFISKIVGLNYTFLICSIISFISVIGFIIVIKILPDFKSRQVLNSQSS